MVIFISQKTIRDRHGAELDALETDYVSFFRKEGVFPGNPVFIPVANNVENAAELTRALSPDLIVLTGGNNIDPRSFGLDVVLDDLAHNRDVTEKFLFDYAVLNAIPILGICRGFHFINVMLKGRLTLNIKNHPPAIQHSCLHDGNEYVINSFHNHAIVAEDIAQELERVVVEDKSGIVEGYAGKITGKSGVIRILGVQWHPERPGADVGLFKKLIARYIIQGRGN